MWGSKGAVEADGGREGGSSAICLFSAGVPVEVCARLNEGEGAAGGERRRRSARTQLHGAEAALLGAGQTSQEVTCGCGIVTVVSQPGLWLAAGFGILTSLGWWLVLSVVVVACETQKVMKAASIPEVTSDEAC